MLRNIFIGLALLSFPASAAVERGAELDPAYIAKELQIASRIYGYETKLLPLVIADKGRVYALTQNPRAYFVYVPGIIIVDHTAIYDDMGVVTRSYLIHELVHHIQFIMGGRASICQKEAEAYAVQNKFLAENGEAPVWVPACEEQ